MGRIIRLIFFLSDPTHIIKLNLLYINKKGDPLTSEDAIDSKWIMGSPTYLTVFLK